MTLFKVASATRPGVEHQVDTEARTCTCEAFFFARDGNPNYQCKHMEGIDEGIDMDKKIAPVIIEQASPTKELSIQDAMSYGKMFVDSGYFKDLRSIAQAVVRIKAGEELGLGPMASIKGVWINDRSGQPELHANVMAALIKRSPKYDFRVSTSDASGCVLAWFEGGQAVGQSSFTMVEAKQAGLVRPKGPWETYPKAMCFNRALSQGAKMYAADAFMGLPIYYQGETSSDTPQVTVEQPTPALPTQTTPKLQAPPVRAPQRDSTKDVTRSDAGKEFMQAVEESIEPPDELAAAIDQHRANGKVDLVGYYRKLFALQAKLPQGTASFGRVPDASVGEAHVRGLQKLLDTHGITYGVMGS
jgi:hypothetical protein